ncbi:glycosyltransferase family 39 protein [Cytophagaceae bacterium DM2B3-1]|uniref:Glycosyltransferase family 39 protein n=1 Tax=Xanthocytophaga flava TaxID=3048013 RepID=A0ABT7CN47_9BACT|nr:glycosyltransferase family 39 protein [Xanthocytophaga flavus]MDJ1472136.1 glycosyltransferase family 39 protein [Xanthocytophaga flavus]MDJ1495133.1 glycosyltransferase family 39 protein [Xanthocytophaga flavus]
MILQKRASALANSRYVNIYIFFLFFFVRLAFVFFSRFDNYELSGDSGWIIKLGMNVLDGNLDFDIGRFIAAPFYPYFIAVNMWIFGSFWNVSVVFFQLVLSALSGVALYKIALYYFDKLTSLLATHLYALFPLTFWWVHTFATEMVFQCFLIFAIYYLIVFVHSQKKVHLIVSALLFSLCYLTKSHILLFSPFIILYIFYNLKSAIHTKIIYGGIYGGICLLASLPFGVYNITSHQIYVISSNGLGYQYYLGNSDAGYVTIVDVPPVGSEAYQKMKNINEDAGFFNGSKYDSILVLPQRVKQSLFLQESMRWIILHPQKFLKIKVYNLFFFLMPGVSFRHYSIGAWAFSFILSCPIYLLAYSGMFTLFRQDFKKHIWMAGLFIAMLVFSVGIYVQNRFRTITLEPFFLIYAAYTLTSLYQKWKLTQKT